MVNSPSRVEYLDKSLKRSRIKIRRRSKNHLEVFLANNLNQAEQVSLVKSLSQSKTTKRKSKTKSQVVSLGRLKPNQEVYLAKLQISKQALACLENHRIAYSVTNLDKIKNPEAYLEAHLDKIKNPEVYLVIQLEIKNKEAYLETHRLRDLYSDSLRKTFLVQLRPIFSLKANLITMQTKVKILMLRLSKRMRPQL